MAIFWKNAKARSAGLFGFLLFELCALTPCAVADSYRQYLHVGVALNDSLFVESEDGRAINEETGLMVSYQADLYKRFANDVFVKVSVAQGSNTLDYDGYTQGLTRYGTKTEYYISEFGGIIGRQTKYLASYLGASRSYRERNILALTLSNGGQIRGTYEELTATKLFLGFEIYFWQSKKMHLKWINEGSGSINSNLHVEHDGAFDPNDLRPGPLVSWYSALEFFYDLNGRWGLSLRPEYQYTLIEHSKNFNLYQNGNKIGTSRLPNTEFQEMGVELGLSLRF